MVFSDVPRCPGDSPNVNSLNVISPNDISPNVISSTHCHFTECQFAECHFAKYKKKYYFYFLFLRRTCRITVERSKKRIFSLCGWFTAGRRNRLTKFRNASVHEIASTRVHVERCMLISDIT